MTTTVASAGRRLQSRLLWSGLVVVLAATVAGAWIAYQRADRDTERRVERAATAAATGLEDEVATIVDSLDGADAVAAAGGGLDVESFTAFAADVLARTELPSMTLVAVEADGSFRPTARLAADGTGAGPDDRVAPALAEALDRATPDGSPVAARAGDAFRAPGIVLARSVVDRSGALVGFVAVDVPDTRLSAVLAESVPAGTRVVATADDVTLVGEPFETRVSTAEARATVADRSWVLVVGPRDGIDLDAMWATIAAGLVVSTWLVSLAVVTARRQGRMLAANAEAERGRAQDRAVQEMIGHLARAISASDVVAALRDLLPPAVGAQTATLGLVAGDGNLRVLSETTTPDDPGEWLACAGSGSIVERVLSEQEPAWLASPLEWRHDELAGAVSRGGNALALLPIGFGDIRGVLAVSYARFHVFDPGEQQVLETVAVLAAQALDRGHRYDREHAAAVAFQKAALPDELPVVPGLSITARYRPALKHAAVGGDWYDVVPLDDRRTLLVVGDVVGHGMEAAATMGRLRTALRVIAALDPDPGRILGRLGHQVDAIPNAFCATVLCAVIDHHAQTFTWSRAGHLPPLLITPDGAVLLDQRCAPPLGVVVGAGTPVHTHDLRPRDRLMLFTDGIVERRDESIDTGLDRLAVMATTLADLDASAFTDTIVEAIAPHESQVDDIAILVVALDAACPAPGPTTPPADR